MKKLFLLGGSGGIGSEVKLLLSQQYEIDAPTKNELDMTKPIQVDNINLSGYDCVINASGYNVGAYKGWMNNGTKEQINCFNCNFLSPVILAKNYLKNNKKGQFVYFTSRYISDPISYNIFYITAKQALTYALGTIAKENTNFHFLELRLGKVRTKMLQQNYQGAKTEAEIRKLYDKEHAADPKLVASSLVSGLERKLTLVEV